MVKITRYLNTFKVCLYREIIIAHTEDLVSFKDICKLSTTTNIMCEDLFKAYHSRHRIAADFALKKHGNA